MYIKSFAHFYPQRLQVERLALNPAYKGLAYSINKNLSRFSTMGFLFYSHVSKYMNIYGDICG